MTWYIVLLSICSIGASLIAFRNGVELRLARHDNRKLMMLLDASERLVELQRVNMLRGSHRVPYRNEPRVN